MREAIIACLVAAVILLANLGGPKLWDRDEPRNAGCAHEMLARSDWVVPYFNSELRTHKPILLYWLMMASYSLLGVSEFAARLPSALMAIGTVLLTYHIAKVGLGRTVGKWAGIVLATFVMFPVIGRAATPDSALMFFSTAALAAFVHFYFRELQDFDQTTVATSPHAESSRPSRAALGFRKWKHAAVIYGLMAFAVLAKGPVGMILPTAVIGMFCLIKRLPHPAPQDHASRPPRGLLAFLRRMLRPFKPVHFVRTCWSMRPVTALTMAALIAMPWYIWVGLRTDGVWLQEFFGEHNFGRATRSMEGHSGSPFLYYPLALMACCFPWSVFTIPTGVHTSVSIRDGWTSGGKPSSKRTYDLVAFLVCWIAVYVVLFSIASTKLPSYVAPCYPAIAILIANYVVAMATGSSVPASFPRHHRLWIIGLSIGMLGGIGISIGLAIGLRQAFPEEWKLAAIGILPFLGGVIALWAVKMRQIHFSAATYASAAVLFSIALHAVASQAISRHQSYSDILPTAEANQQLACLGRLEPTWVFYAGRPVKQFGSDQAIAAVSFLGQSPDHRLILTSREFNLHDLSTRVQIMARCDYFLRNQELYLVRSADFIAGP